MAELDRPLPSLRSFLLRPTVRVPWLFPGHASVAPPLPSVRRQALDPALSQLGPTLQRADLEHEAEPDDLPVEALDQAGGGRRGAARGEHVVDDQHPLAR